MKNECALSWGSTMRSNKAGMASTTYNGEASDNAKCVGTDVAGFGVGK